MPTFEMMPRDNLEKRYFPYPNSLDPLPPVYREGLIPVTIFAMMSLISVTALLIFITHRLVSWRKHYREYVGYNQYVILIYNLLLADLQQAIAFVAVEKVVFFGDVGQGAGGGAHGARL